MYFLLNIMQVIKSERMRQVGACGSYGRQEGCMQVFVGIPVGKVSLGRPRHRWGIILKLIFKT